MSLVGEGEPELGRTERLPGWTLVMGGFLQVSLDASGSLSSRRASSSTWGEVKTDEFVGREGEGHCVPQAGGQLLGESGEQIGEKWDGGRGGCDVSSEDGTRGG